MTADREAAIREALDGGVPLLHREDRMARRQKAEDALDSLLAELDAARSRIAKHVTHAEMLEFALGNANERERVLREALRQIKDYEWHPGQPPTPDVRGIARAALDAAGEQS